MKKIIAFVLVAVLALALVACGPTGPSQYETFMKTEVGQTVTVEAYVQGHQSWWNDQITVYLQDKDGGYFAYNMECTKDQADKLTEGTKIKVTGKKAEWAGEIEIYNPCQLLEIIEGDTWVAPTTDVTAKMGTDELIDYMNRKVSFKGLTVVAYGENGVVDYDPDKSDSDVYFKAQDDKGNVVTFCVEYYLTNSDTETYKNALNLKVGDVIDVEGFLYWYNGANPHVTGITTTARSQYNTFLDTEVGQTVTIEAYVQGHQSWWNNQLTVYLQDKDGGYFAYNMECTEEQANSLTAGTKIKVTGKKAEWAGEIEIYNPCQLVEIIEGDTWVAPATDVTAKMGTDELIDYMNRKVSFKGLTVVAYDEDGVVSYDPDKSDSDVYFKAQDENGNVVTFCVEYYLTNSTTETYQNALNLKVGDKIDVEGFLYWYNGANPHVTSVTVAD